MYTLRRQQWFPGTLEDVFAFFANADNLGRITPPWLRFTTTTPGPIDIRAGTEIDHIIRIGGIPVRWRTLIKEWNAPHRFVDKQVRGPYSLWEHTHEFTSTGGGVLMTDTVRYKPPLGILGRLAHAVVIRRMVSSIFDYRFAAMERLLGDPSRQTA